MRSEVKQLQQEQGAVQEKIKENNEKIKMNKQLPYLVANVVEILDVSPEEDEEAEGGNVDLNAKKDKCVVVKTSTRQTVFLPEVGLVDPKDLKPGDLVGVHKESYLILDTLPAEYDSRVKVKTFSFFSSLNKYLLISFHSLISNYFCLLRLWK